MYDQPVFGRIDIRDEISAFRRRKIISAASELFARNGYDNTRLDAVAEHLGVTKPSIYSEFNTKADLLAEICQGAVDSVLSATAGVADSSDGIVARTRDFMRQFAIAVCKHQHDVTVYAREQKSLTPQGVQQLRLLRHALDARVVALLQEGVDSGHFHVGSVRIAALTIQGMVSWMYVWYRPDGTLALPDLADEIADQVLAILLKR